MCKFCYYIDMRNELNSWYGYSTEDGFGSIYNNLNKASKDLDLLLLDIKNYPDKYLSIPGTKRRQRKAIEESKNGIRD